MIFGSNENTKICVRNLLTLWNILWNQTCIVRCIELLQKYDGPSVFGTSLIAASSSDFYVIKAQNIVFHPNANTLCKQETQDCQNPLLIPMFYVGFWTSLSVQVWANTQTKHYVKVSFILTKGQLISDWLFGVFNFPKNQHNIWWISALEFKKWLIMLNSPN